MVVRIPSYPYYRIYPRFVKGEGGEGEEPPEGIQEDEDGDDDDDDVSRHSSESADLRSDSRLPSPITVLQENCNTQHPIDLANSEQLSNNVEDATIRGLSLASAGAPTTPPPPILQRCSSGESLASTGDDNAPSMFQPVPPRLATMVHESSPLISSSSSPPLLLPVTATTPPLKSPVLADGSANNAVLDFSTKKRSAENVSPVLNLKKTAPVPSDTTAFTGNDPLDLSVGSTKKRELEDSPVTNMHKKPARMPPASPWTSPLLTYQIPYFTPGGVPLMQKNNAAGTNIPSLDPNMWNGKAKVPEKSHFGTSMSPNDASKALEKMSELSKLGVMEDFRPSMPLPSNIGSGSGRQSAWQSHWMNKGAEQAKDVLKCVWCKLSFPSLAALTAHMQEAKHCGVNVPVSPLQPMTALSTPPQTSTTTSAVSSSSVGSTKTSPSDLNLLIKETMPLPRKLVRGQDVWLGKGAEQTRQILKCMWCGQSFRSLAEMTSHMQQTQHYTNIISQEQIISWKSSDDSKSGSSSNASGQSGLTTSVNSSSANSHVSAVLTCKVCDQAFSSLKELSTHMVKNSHYKEHIMRSLTESGGRRRQTREKRKKSLPVRKLLELERAQNELKNGDSMMMTMMMMGKGGLHSSSSNRIPCEKCGDKIDVSMIVDHIRICVGNISDEKKNLLKNALMSTYNNAGEPFSENNSLKSGKDLSSNFHQRLSPKTSETCKDGGLKSDAKSPSSSTSSSPSVLNAIEKLIEKSFDPRSRHAVTGYSSHSPGSSTSPIGSSILKRLGIDESVDYTKPLMEVNLPAAKAYALGFPHNSAHYDQNYFASGRRERSGSESSSISERGSSRHESSTPDRKIDERTPRTTPEKRVSTPPVVPKVEPMEDDEKSETAENDGSLLGDEEVRKIKEEPLNNDKEDRDKTERKEDRDKTERKEMNERRSSNESCAATPKSIPAEDEMGEDLSTGRRSRKDMSSPIAASPACKSVTGRESVSPRTNFSGSPTNSERSITPRSTSDKKSSGSLGALSSMFDSLSGTNTSPASSEAPAQSNKASNHPLAALQKLCDKTETHHHSGNGSNSRGGGGSTTSTNHLASGGASQPNNMSSLLQYSWACNDGVISESLLKCAFCDTVLNSKGMYRHHLSKTHFVKDGVIPEPVPLKSPTGGGGAVAAAATTASASNSSLPVSLTKNSSAAVENNCKAGGSVSVSSSCSSIKSPQSQSTFDESPHSKFLKYTELAKQLSSKY